METVLVVYAICASVLLIWSTSRRDNDFRQQGNRSASRSRTSYATIPRFLLLEWIVCDPNLIVFELDTGREGNACEETFPGMLTISMTDLPILLKWLPLNSTVVFSRGGGIERFDAQIEDTLLRLGIEAIYFLDRSAGFPSSVAKKD